MIALNEYTWNERELHDALPISSRGCMAQFEEGGLLSDTRENAKIGDKFDDNSIMPPLIIKKEIDVIDSGNGSGADLVSTEML